MLRSVQKWNWTQRRRSTLILYFLKLLLKKLMCVWGFFNTQLAKVEHQKFYFYSFFYNSVLFFPSLTFEVDDLYVLDLSTSSMEVLAWNVSSSNILPLVKTSSERHQTQWKWMDGDLSAFEAWASFQALFGQLNICIQNGVWHEGSYLAHFMLKVR